MGNNGSRSDESSPTVEAMQAALSQSKGQVEDLNAQLGERDAKLGDIQADISSKSSMIETLTQELNTANDTIALQEKSLAQWTEDLANAIGSYRSIILSANPAIPEEMVAGESVADIDASLEKAKGLATKIKASLEAELSTINRKTAIPAGAPERSGPDISSLSPREKIQYAIEKEAK